MTVTCCSPSPAPGLSWVVAAAMYPLSLLYARVPDPILGPGHGGHHARAGCTPPARDAFV
eukprot:1142174-Pelagomonas_calceolata.AAC.5